jgi:hypothetical protein
MSRRLEVIILVLILGLSGSFFFSCAQKARKAASMTQCQQLLKMITLGLHSHHDARGHFPLAAIPNKELPPDERVSWIMVLDTSFLQGHMDPEWRIRKEKGWQAPEHRPMVQYPPPYIHCTAGQSKEDDNVTNFVGISGVGKDAATWPLADPRSGFFGYDRRITRADVKDGSQNTMVITETFRNNGHWAAGGPATVRGLDPDDLPYLGSRGQFNTYHQRLPVAFLDGSIRAFSEDLDPKIFEAFATIAGDEQIDPAAWE